MIDIKVCEECFNHFFPKCQEERMCQKCVEETERLGEALLRILLLNEEKKSNGKTKI